MGFGYKGVSRTIDCKDGASCYAGDLVESEWKLVTGPETPPGQCSCIPDTFAGKKADEELGKNWWSAMLFINFWEKVIVKGKKLFVKMSANCQRS